ncbi:unnamed protein product, partial [Rangifer tarandus platyrhynchus]
LGMRQIFLLLCFPPCGSDLKSGLPRWFNSMLKSRDITLPAKVHLVKAMGFPVV